MAASDREIIGRGWWAGQERDQASGSDAVGAVHLAGPDADAGWFEAWILERCGSAKGTANATYL